MNEVELLLGKFTPIGLERLEPARLLDRMDTKYAFHIGLLPKVLELAADNYYILEVNDQRSSEYSSLYFDTPDFNLYHDHLTGRLGRYKIRFREYLKSGIKYFEIKHKNNKRRTIKHRILKDKFSTIIEEAEEDFIRSNTGYNPGKLSAMLWVNYSRITLMSKISLERVTIDTGLKFNAGEKTKHFDKLVIAEVKQVKSGTSSFKKIMKEMKIRPVAISKYCLGIVNLFENVKKNNFKSKLNLIKKIQNGVAANIE